MADRKVKVDDKVKADNDNDDDDDACSSKSLSILDEPASESQRLFPIQGLGSEDPDVEVGSIEPEEPCGQEFTDSELAAAYESTVISIWYMLCVLLLMVLIIY